MPTYILKGGRHVDASGKVYENGARFESDDEELDTKFVNKFVRDDGRRSGAGRVSEQRRRGVKQLIDSDDTDWEDDDRAMLEAMSDKRFAQVSKEAGLKEEEEAPKTPGKPQPGGESSSEFNVPEGSNLVVTKKGEKFQVARKTQPNRALNEAPLEQKDVQAFLDKHSGKK